MTRRIDKIPGTVTLQDVQTSLKELERIQALFYRIGDYQTPKKAGSLMAALADFEFLLTQ